MITNMLIIYVNILCVLFLAYVYLRLCEKEKASVADKVKRWLVILSAAGVFTKMGRSLIFILIIVAVGWAVSVKEREKKNVGLDT